MPPFPPNGIFPYCKCDRSLESSTWRATLYQALTLPGPGQSRIQQVTIKIFSDPDQTCRLRASKLEINLNMMATVNNNFNSIRGAVLNGRSISSVFWDLTSPIIKFTKLGLDCSSSSRPSYLQFNITGTTLGALCDPTTKSGLCQYCCFDTDASAGICPTSFFPYKMIYG